MCLGDSVLDEEPNRLKVGRVDDVLGVRIIDVQAVQIAHRPNTGSGWKSSEESHLAQQHILHHGAENLVRRVLMVHLRCPFDDNKDPGHDLALANNHIPLLKLNRTCSGSQCTDLVGLQRREQPDGGDVSDCSVDLGLRLFLRLDLLQENRDLRAPDTESISLFESMHFTTMPARPGCRERSPFPSAAQFKKHSLLTGVREGAQVEAAVKAIDDRCKRGHVIVLHRNIALVHLPADRHLLRRGHGKERWLEHVASGPRELPVSRGVPRSNHLERKSPPELMHAPWMVGHGAHNGLEVRPDSHYVVLHERHEALTLNGEHGPAAVNHRDVANPVTVVLVALDLQVERAQLIDPHFVALVRADRDSLEVERIRSGRILCCASEDLQLDATRFLRDRDRRGSPGAIELDGLERLAAVHVRLELGRVKLWPLLANDHAGLCGRLVEVQEVSVRHDIVAEKCVQRTLLFEDTRSAKGVAANRNLLSFVVIGSGEAHVLIGHFHRCRGSLPLVQQHAGVRRAVEARGSFLESLADFANVHMASFALHRVIWSTAFAVSSHCECFVSAPLALSDRLFRVAARMAFFVLWYDTLDADANIVLEIEACVEASPEGRAPPRETRRLGHKELVAFLDSNRLAAPSHTTEHEKGPCGAAKVVQVVRVALSLPGDAGVTLGHPLHLGYRGGALVRVAANKAGNDGPDPCIGARHHIRQLLHE
mmetsp:Transcript_12897/g.41180  ORF Transcript_12897/g.41180 Transcript_12897/m.41180 type:complete len:709 (-) Transcript_12897:234-2360(-)